MTTGDEEAESLVDNLFREVDDHFKDLEREYHQARQGLAAADTERRDHPIDPLEASNERFELMSEVATLRAEVARQADDLDERDRMLAELGDRIAGFEAQIASANADATELRTARQQMLAERREQERLKALLDARQAERQELAEVAHRLQNEKENVEDLLKTSLSRFEEAESVRAEMNRKVTDLEAAHQAAGREHDSRAHELIEARNEAVQLAAQLEDLTSARIDAEERAERAEGVAERKASEVAYLNRRIDAMTPKIDQAAALEQEVARLERENTLVERRVTELERELAAQVAETKASAAAVEALAARSSVHDELVTRIAELEAALTEALRMAGAPTSTATGAPTQGLTVTVPHASSGEVQSLAERARELGTRRANQQQSAPAEPDASPPPPPIEFDGTESPEQAAAVVAAPDQTATVPSIDFADVSGPTAFGDDDRDASVEPDRANTPQPPIVFDGTEVPAVVADSEPDDGQWVSEVLPLSDDETALEAPAGQPSWLPGGEPADAEATDAAAADADQADANAADANATDAGAADAGHADEESADPTAADADQAGEASADADQAGEESADAAGAEATAQPGATWESSLIDASTVIIADVEPPPRFDLAAPASPVGASASGKVAFRKRTVLPADLTPNTPEAIEHLLSQVGVVAIVDARSTCARTGIRPSDLFERLASVRDRFDVPIEVVVTPVSTPVGGAPQLPAIGVHKVEGADTVADRVRALCMGFPPDQPLVVIAGDDHVRRAAIGEEANVIEPAAILEIAAR